MRGQTLYSSSFFAHLAVLGLLLPVLALSWECEGVAERATFEIPLAMNHLAVAFGITLWALGAGFRRAKHRYTIPVVLVASSALGSLAAFGLDWFSGLVIIGVLLALLLSLAPMTLLRVEGILVTSFFGLSYGQCYAGLGYTPKELVLSTIAVVALGAACSVFGSWYGKRARPCSA